MKVPVLMKNPDPFIYKSLNLTTPLLKNLGITEVYPARVELTVYYDEFDPSQTQLCTSENLNVLLVCFQGKYFLLLETLPDAVESISSIGGFPISDAESIVERLPEGLESKVYDQAYESLNELLKKVPEVDTVLFIEEAF